MEHDIILYSTGCPKCAVLKKKLERAQLHFEENKDVDAMRLLGIKSAPMLDVDGKLLNFSDAVRWVNDYISERTPSD